MNDYQVKLRSFEGPLDLLLYLIRKNEIDIYDIPIAEITRQYLEYLELMRELNLDIAGEFLVMAATLLYIKSKMLLPQEEINLEEEIPEEDPRQELVKRLLEYKKFKEVAQLLKEREEEGSVVFKRFVPEGERNLEFEEEIQGFEASVFDLISAFTKVMKNIPKEEFQVVLEEEYSVEEKIDFILSLLDQKGVIYFSSIWKRIRNRMEAVVFFLALLELIRLKKILIRQIGLFGEIKIFRPLPVSAHAGG
jgi:segregation and condensation protein A